MKVRFLGHSCVEIIGKHHILIDPDFIHPPQPGVEYICISHAHRDHIGRVAEVPEGFILASPDVCEYALKKYGVERERLCAVKAGDRQANIRILPGFSVTNNFIHLIFSLLIKHKIPEPAGTPLSFLVEDEASLLHIGDANQAPENVSPDILCLPWRKAPYKPEAYQESLINLAKHLSAQYILPIHYDLPGTEANPQELISLVDAKILEGNDWHYISKQKG